MALLVTHLSASVATFVWMLIEWIKLGKPSVLGAATGAIAGLAAITPASGFVGPIGAIAIGACSAALCYTFATIIKKKVGYDDSLDVFGVHGVGGFLGTVMCGIFASSALGGNNGGNATYSIADSVMTQLMAATAVAVYAMIATFVILKVMDITMGIRIDGTSEAKGLDLAEHEERGYIL
jgi:Amt family ammonium transporter